MCQHEQLTKRHHPSCPNSADLADAQLPRAPDHAVRACLRLVHVDLSERKHFPAALTARHDALLAVLLVQVPVALAHLLLALAPPAAHAPELAHAGLVKRQVPHAHPHAAALRAVHKPQVAQVGQVLVDCPCDDAPAAAAGAGNDSVKAVIR